jgi:hypothetical protein
VRHLKAFGRFWYDFIVGDDWRIAAAVVVTMAVVYTATQRDVNAWWLLPLVVLVMLGSSLRIATRRTSR